MNAQEFKDKIASIYNIANELGKEFKITKCTPDGHLLGAIGQIAAKMAFELDFGSERTEHNCTWTSDDGTKIDIQVRSSGKGSIAIREEPEYLIAIGINENGKLQLLYNGPGKYVWEIIEKQNQSQKSASNNQLKLAQLKADTKFKIPIKNDIFDNYFGV